LRYEQPVQLTGSIYAGADRAKLLFKFTRKATRTGSRLNVLREFSYPDGRLAAREWVVYDGDFLTFFALEELQTEAKGSALIRRDPGNPATGAIEFNYVKPSGHSGGRRESLQSDTLINDMVAPFLASNWPALLRGEKPKCHFIVVPRRETVSFSFSKESESQEGGHETVMIRMEPTSPVLRGLVEPIFFKMQKQPPHRVLEYIGRTTPKVQVGKGWKNLDAVTVFDWK
jgi:hypothetical protein